MADGFQITLASDENFDQLLDLIEDYQRFYKVRDINRERNRRFFSRLLQDRGAGLQFIAWRDGQAVGFTTLYFPYSSTRASDYALMNDLYVSRGLRGEGIGRALVEEAKRAARDRGYDTLFWMTANDNLIAQDLYDRLEASKSLWIEYSLPTGLSDG